MYIIDPSTEDCNGLDCKLAILDIIDPTLRIFFYRNHVKQGINNSLSLGQDVHFAWLFWSRSINFRTLQLLFNIRVYVARSIPPDIGQDARRTGIDTWLCNDYQLAGFVPTGQPIGGWQRCLSRIF